MQLEQVETKLPFANDREPPANELFKGFRQDVANWIIARPSHTMDKSKCSSAPGPRVAPHTSSPVLTLYHPVCLYPFPSLSFSISVTHPRVPRTRRA